MDDGLPVVGHQSNQSRVPLVCNLGEGRCTRGHENLSYPVLKRLHRLIVHSQECLGRPLLRHLVGEAPDAFPLRKTFLRHSAPGKYSDLKASHAEQDVWVVLAIHTDEAVLPLKSCHAPWQSVLHVPEDSPPQVHVVLHQPHSGIPWPALLIVIANNVFIVWVRVLREIPLDQILGLVRLKLKEHVDLVNVPAVQPYRMLCLCLDILEAEEIVWMVRWASDLARPGQTQE
mmetsp:Transcript_12946/g.36300  ORF Transcript_12946/g.36300 Transcript_12946/m.36300 type:complete len:230 (+) Transcript_12946:5114-5803(+)